MPNNNNDSHEFKPLLTEIEESPVSPLGRVTFWIIVCVILFAGIWMFLGKVDIVVSSRGIVIPDGEVKILQPLSTGVISNIAIKKGDFVKKGQLLMEIDPSETEPALESLKKNLEHIQLEEKRLKAISENKPFYISDTSYNIDLIKTQQEVYASTKRSHRMELKVKEEELKKLTEEILSAQTKEAQYSSLLNTAQEKEARLKEVIDIIAKDEYEKTKQEVLSYSTGIEETQHKLKELQYQKSQIREEIEYIKESFKTKTLTELADKQKQVNELSARIQQISFKNTKQKLTSPVDGYVDNLLVHTIGGVVTPAEKIISIVPMESPLIIKANVLNKDIGFVEESMPVSIKIDTFDFQKYGILKGKVKIVSKNSIQDEHLGPVYEVLIEPMQKSLTVEGKQQTISSGMSLTAEIKVGKRRIIEFFIYPLIKYLDESISVR